MRGVSVELLRQSPSRVLRPCAALAEAHQPVAQVSSYLSYSKYMPEPRNLDCEERRGPGLFVYLRSKTFAQEMLVTSYEPFSHSYLVNVIVIIVKNSGEVRSQCAAFDCCRVLDGTTNNRVTAIVCTPRTVGSICCGLR